MAFKLLHWSSILKRVFRDLQRVDYWGVLMLRLCAQIHCQYEARTISAFSIPSDTAKGVFAFEKLSNAATTAIISHGARDAINLPSDTQFVIGVALPIGLTSDSPDWGMFFYCSFEHAFLRSEPCPTK